MNTCYKCGRELSGSQMECEYGCTPEMSSEEMEQSSREWAREMMVVDWSKVTTLEQLLQIMRLNDEPIYFRRDSSEARTLAQFLKPVDPDDLGIDPS